MGQSIEILEKHNLRKTPVRIKVMDYFLEKKEAISHAHLEQGLGDLDRVTLYRTLKKFEESGIIHNVMDGTGIARYALCHGSCEHDHHEDHHAHFNCGQCGKTFCLDEVNVPNIMLPKGYTQESAHLVIKGTCETCSI